MENSNIKSIEKKKQRLICSHQFRITSRCNQQNLLLNATFLYLLQQLPNKGFAIFMHSSEHDPGKDLLILACAILISLFAILYIMIAVIASLAILAIILTAYTPRFLKWLLPPKLRVGFADYTFDEHGGEYKLGKREIAVKAGEGLVLGIEIRPKWSYHPTIIEVLGNFKIERGERFVRGLRPWEKPYPEEIHGYYKVVCTGLILRPGAISDPTMIDVKIDPPLRRSEERVITIKIDTEESRKSFIEDLQVTEKKKEDA